MYCCASTLTAVLPTVLSASGIRISKLTASSPKPLSIHPVRAPRPARHVLTVGLPLVPGRVETV